MHSGEAATGILAPLLHLSLFLLIIVHIKFYL